MFRIFGWIIAIFVLVCEAHGRRYTVHWDANIISELKREFKMEVLINDWMDILCPRKSGFNQPFPVLNNLHLNLYNVTYENYNHCDIRGQQKLLQCTDPRRETKLTAKFQQKSPSPIGFVFLPGHTYYYVSKPSNTRNNRSCSRDTMRMSVTVKERHKDTQGRFHKHKQVTAKNPKIKEPDEQESSSRMKPALASYSSASSFIDCRRINSVFPFLSDGYIASLALSFTSLFTSIFLTDKIA